MSATHLPDFESARLLEIAHAVKRRGKAIRSHGKLSCDRTFEASGERMNLDFSSLLRTRVRFSVWADGVFWLGISEPGSRREGGWAFKDELHGRLGELMATDVIERFERTINLPTEARAFWPEIAIETDSPPPT